MLYGHSPDVLCQRECSGALAVDCIAHSRAPVLRSLSGSADENRGARPNRASNSNSTLILSCVAAASTRIYPARALATLQNFPGGNSPAVLCQHECLEACAVDDITRSRAPVLNIDICFSSVRESWSAQRICLFSETHSRAAFKAQ